MLTRGCGWRNIATQGSCIRGLPRREIRSNVLGSGQKFTSECLKIVRHPAIRFSAGQAKVPFCSQAQICGVLHGESSLGAQSLERNLFQLLFAVAPVWTAGCSIFEHLSVGVTARPPPHKKLHSNGSVLVTGKETQTLFIESGQGDIHGKGKCRGLGWQGQRWHGEIGKGHISIFLCERSSAEGGNCSGSDGESAGFKWPRAFPLFRILVKLIS